MSVCASPVPSVLRSQGRLLDSPFGLSMTRSVKAPLAACMSVTSCTQALPVAATAVPDPIGPNASLFFVWRLNAASAPFANGATTSVPVWTMSTSGLGKCVEKSHCFSSRFLYRFEASVVCLFGPRRRDCGPLCTLCGGVG
jgi:hypothetical protein